MNTPRSAPRSRIAPPLREVTANLPGPPMYFHIARAIQSRIFHGLYVPGGLIPSENELGEEFGVTRITVRQALQQLTARGVLVTRRGSGTYVSDAPRAVRPVNFLGYLDDLLMQGMTKRVELGRVEELVAPAAVAAQLELRARQRVLMVERTRFLNGGPVDHVINYLPLGIGRAVPVAELATKSLTALMREYCDITITTAEQSFTAVGAPADVAEHLQVPLGSPLLRSEIVLADGSHPYSVAIDHYRPEHAHFTATLIGFPSAGKPRLRRVRASRREPRED